MHLEQIVTEVKSAVAKVSGIPVTSIADSASYRDDLGLDSLSILEIAVEAEYAFGIKLDEDELSSVKTIRETAELVAKYLGEPVVVCTAASLSPA